MTNREVETDELHPGTVTGSKRLDVGSFALCEQMQVCRCGAVRSRLVGAGQNPRDERAQPQLRRGACRAR
jgi:hypothetical protein